MKRRDTTLHCSQRDRLLVDRYAKKMEMTTIEMLHLMIWWYVEGIALYTETSSQA